MEGYQKIKKKSKNKVEGNKLCFWIKHYLQRTLVGGS